jgi:hypothetical protein
MTYQTLEYAQAWARAVCISAYLPEMEVHARSEDRKDHDLETAHGRKFGYCW